MTRLRLEGQRSNSQSVIKFLRDLGTAIQSLWPRPLVINQKQYYFVSLCDFIVSVMRSRIALTNLYTAHCRLNTQHINFHIALVFPVMYINS